MCFRLIENCLCSSMKLRTIMFVINEYISKSIKKEYVEGVYSQPIIMARIAIADGLSKSAVELLIDAGHEVDLEPEKLDGFDAVVIRSATKLTKDLDQSAPSLRLIGRAGVGVDNIDISTTANAGILVY